MKRHSLLVFVLTALPLAASAQECPGDSPTGLVEFGETVEAASGLSRSGYYRRYSRLAERERTLRERVRETHGRTRRRFERRLAESKEARRELRRDAREHGIPFDPTRYRTLEKRMDGIREGIWREESRMGGYVRRGNVDAVRESSATILTSHERLERVRERLRSLRRGPAVAPSDAPISPEVARRRLRSLSRRLRHGRDRLETLHLRSSSAYSNLSGGYAEATAASYEVPTVLTLRRLSRIEARMAAIRRRISPPPTVIEPAPLASEEMPFAETPDPLEIELAEIEAESERLDSLGAAAPPDELARLAERVAAFEAIAGSRP